MLDDAEEPAETLDYGYEDSSICRTSRTGSPMW